MLQCVFLSAVEPCHYGTLCEQLRPCAHKWTQIAQGLQFTNNEIANLQADPVKLLGGAESYMSGVISVWINRGAAGGREEATLNALQQAINQAGFGRIQLTLN